MAPMFTGPFNHHPPLTQRTGREEHRLGATQVLGTPKWEFLKMDPPFLGVRRDTKTEQPTVDGCDIRISGHFETMVETIACWYLRWESDHPRASWVVRNGFRNHPQYQSFEKPTMRGMRTTYSSHVTSCYWHHYMFFGVKGRACASVSIHVCV